MRVGMFALMSPVMTSTEGRCVASTRWIRGARLAGEPGDELLYFLADDHHEIGELVDHHDDVRHRLKLLRLFRIRGERIIHLAIGHLVVEARGLRAPIQFMSL